MRILVTGYLGFIGKHLTSCLKKEGHQVFGIDKKDDNDLLILLPDEYPKNINVIYHLAAQISVDYSFGYPSRDLSDNVSTTLRLMSLYPNAKIIYTGSGGASEQEEIISPYGLSKKMAGEYLKLLHKNYVICNLPNVYGEGGHGVVENFIEDDPVIVFGGYQTRDFVHVDDIVDGLIKAMDWKKGEYFMGSFIETKIIDLARATGKKIIVQGTKKGDLKRSIVPNTTPNWRPITDVINYIESKIC